MPFCYNKSITGNVHAACSNRLAANLHIVAEPECVINSIVSERTSKVGVPRDKALEFHTAEEKEKKKQCVDQLLIPN